VLCLTVVILSFICIYIYIYMCVCVCVCVLFHFLFEKEDKVFNVPVSKTVNESAVYVVPCYVSLVGDYGLSQQPRFVS